MMSQGEFNRAFNGLTPRRREVLEKFLAGETDEAIAQSLYISQPTVRQHIKAIAEAFGFENEFSDQRRSKRPELIALFAKYKPELLGNSQSAIAPPLEVATAKSQEITPNTGEPIHNLDAAQCKSNFVGRENAIARINTLIRQGAKVILIQAPGGVGKTTLAQEYLKSQGFDLILELLMAKEKENITLVESVIEEWLKRDFQEEPGREFGVTLGRLKRQLQTRRVGVLIDNLEPALDGQGRFIEPHRRYVELLRVLADSSVQSVTLITSREPLAECVGITNYSLPSLDEKAWQYFFSRDIEIDEITLKEMHKAYGGNALAMTILCDPIQRDGGMVAYWQEHKVEADLLVELAVDNLVKEQFNRLENTYPEAYRLLCRLGCYRYQDVPTVPTEGLLCLLWDVSEAQRRRVIESLRSRSLVECFKGEYWLHPVIRAEAISRLRDSEDWEIANTQVAGFWTESVKTIQTVKDALTAFEAYYHYLNIEDYENIGNIIFRGRRINTIHTWENFKGVISLFDDFRRLGLLGHIRPIKELENKFNFTLCGDLILYFNFGFSCVNWWLGKIHLAIQHYKTVMNLMIEYQQKLCSYCDQYDEIYLGSLTSIGYCYLDLFNLNEAEEYFNKVLELSDKHDKNHYKFNFYIESYITLAFIESCKNNPDVNAITQKIEEVFAPDIIGYQHINIYCSAYRLLFAGLAYKNIGETEKAQEKIDQIFQEQNKNQHYIYQQVVGLAHSLQAEIYRIEKDFETARYHHSESIDILEKIGAKSDLAEAYYQLGLTYQTIENTADSQENFNKAIQLFTEMEAPRQIEKVQQAAGKLT